MSDWNDQKNDSGDKGIIRAGLRDHHLRRYGLRKSPALHRKPAGRLTVTFGNQSGKIVHDDGDFAFAKVGGNFRCVFAVNSD